MSDTGKTKLEQRGRMAYLKDDITRLSRERDTLLRPLRERLDRTVPRDQPPADAARPLDDQAAMQELASVAPVNQQLESAITEYNSLAALLHLPGLKRSAY